MRHTAGDNLLCLRRKEDIFEQFKAHLARKKLSQHKQDD
jgi:hypothetical protein